MKIFFDYPPAASTTGRALRIALNAKKKRTVRLSRADVLVRWGSARQVPSLTARLEINSRDAIALASSKFRALQTMQTAGIPTPQFTNDFSNLDPFRNRDGFFYVRGADKVVRFDNQVRQGDLYVSKPVPYKRREYRVHVFDGRVLAIYEKIPNDSTTRPALFKSYNCSFSLSDPAVSRCNAAAQQMAIDAVRSLGLVFGGVDLIRDRHGNFVACEVNSAPGLNSTNLQRWVEAIRHYAQQHLSRS